MGYGLAYPMEAAGVFAMSACELPCWMGVRPGSTTQQEVEEILQSNDIPFHHEWLEEDYPAGTSVWGTGESEEFISYAGGASERHVSRITLIHASACSPDILYTLGMPDELYLYVDTPFAFFVYESFGFEIIFMPGGINSPNLLGVAWGAGSLVSNAPLPDNWSANNAVNLFNYCRD
ncbi:MAG: hypothetical protein AAFU54_19965 [Chloroflexota bacterium]